MPLVILRAPLIVVLFKRYLFLRSTFLILPKALLEAVGHRESFSFPDIKWNNRAHRCTLTNHGALLIDVIRKGVVRPQNGVVTEVARHGRN